MNQRAMPIEEIARKLKPIFGNKIDELYFRYLGATSLEEKNELTQILIGLYQKNLSKLLDQGVLLEPPIENQVKGEYPLANVSYAGKELFPFALQEKDWPRHLCVTGMSGSGKTTFAFQILKNFIEKDKPFLVFDWKKSFRPLVSKDNSLMCFTIGNERISNLFKTNINVPPKGVSPKEWINTLCDLLTESFNASFGVHKILLETLDETFEGWGVYEGGKHYPNWEHIKKMLESKSKEAKGRETGWYESAMRIASVLTFGSFGKVVNYDGKKSMSVEELFDKRVIFELNSLSNIEKKFFCEYILTYIYKLKKASQNKVEEKFNYSILVDEAHNVFLKDKTNFMSESVTDMVYREMREYGTSLICLDQHVSKLSDTVTGNSACHVAFQQQLPQDIYDISGIMQLQDRKDLFSKLPVGSAIVKLSERFASPFLVNAPLIELRKDLVTDEKIKSRMECLVIGNDVEKNEPEFKEEITKVKEVKIEKKIDVEKKEEIKVIEVPKMYKSEFKMPEISNIKAGKPKLEKTEVKEVSKKKTFKLTEKQEVLYSFVLEKLSEGKNLKEIETLLEAGLVEKLYSFVDILSVINYALNQKLKQNEKQEVIVREKKEVPKVTDLSKEERDFCLYLTNNPNHENSTTEVYKLVGLSSRKGNVVKNKLLQRNLIRIEEVKYPKGWKKFIRINH